MIAIQHTQARDIQIGDVAGGHIVKFEHVTVQMGVVDMVHVEVRLIMDTQSLLLATGPLPAAGLPARDDLVERPLLLALKPARRHHELLEELLVVRRRMTYRDNQPLIIIEVRLP